MKKLLMCVALLFAAVTVSAQSAEEVQASLDRLAQLEKLNKPKNTGFAKVDELLVRASEVATESVAISVGLHEANKALSNTNAEGQAAVNLEALQLMLVSATKLSSESLPAVVKLVPEASEEVKSVKNPMKLKGVKSAIDYSNTVVAIVTVESAFQIKTLTEIIKKASELKK